ncbi:GntR family transcriptional regulator [Streptomyces sp. TS71-3]|uniref:GntR family transcriptional regulator n=1 Tax=Streptomyces sp. TS71-3 TaxID=2733862 RepID=UPI001B07D102|nr:GntR family transcriptional regulator [Streptomyces sp. TS71-3]GHJ36600.1 GntR family transcriptional regulator [Streptomyces sp. TS71-3]
MANDARFRVGPSSLTEALYESVRRRIVTGDIKAGEKLTEVRIATEYDVARPTAKACLERLVVGGLLRRSAHKTAVVPQLDDDEIRDLFFSRGTIERAAVVSLAATRTVPIEAERAQTAIELAARDRTFEAQVEADIAFHSALVDGVGSQRLSRMHQIILGEVHLTMGQYQAHRTTAPETVAQKHAAILDAIRTGDSAAAQARLTEHLDHARERLLTARLAPREPDTV